MTADEVQEAVERIRDIAGDDEGAHEAEDGLHQRVLDWISQHSTDSIARELAREALKTQGIDFARWYA